MDLPEGCELIYVTLTNRPVIAVIARSQGGGCAWEFAVEESDLDGLALELRIFDDSWDAFEQIPEFFTALRTARPETLVQLRELLNGIGAKDVTPRDNPHGNKS